MLQGGLIAWHFTVLIRKGMTHGSYGVHCPSSGKGRASDSICLLLTSGER
jgi:hypothetical protein